MCGTIHNHGMMWYGSSHCVPQEAGDFTPGSQGSVFLDPQVLQMLKWTGSYPAVQLGRLTCQTRLSSGSRLSLWAEPGVRIPRVTSQVVDIASLHLDLCGLSPQKNEVKTESKKPCVKKRFRVFYPVSWSIFDLKDATSTTTPRLNHCLFDVNVWIRSVWEVTPECTNGFKSGWLNNDQNLNSWNHTQTINIESGPTKPGKIEAGKTILFLMDYIGIHGVSRCHFSRKKKNNNPSWCSHWSSSHHTPSIHWRFALRTLGFSIGPLHPSLGLIVVLVPPNMIHSCIPGPSMNRSTTFNHGSTWLCNIRGMGFILNPKKNLRCHQTCNFYIHYSIFEAINRHL